MPNSHWWFGAGNVIAPVGLILGLREGLGLEPGWDLFTSANGLFLKGTNSDSTVGTTGSRSSIVLNVAQGGQHSGGDSALVVDRGQGNTCVDTCRSPSRSTTTVGGHSGHAVTLGYRPASTNLKLMIASQRRPIPVGSIMFGTAANSKQSLFSLFNSHGGILGAGTATNTSSDQYSSGTSTGASFPHSHENGSLTQGSGLASGSYTSSGSAGSLHYHAGGNFTVTNNMLRTVVRAFEILDRNSIKGLIGMWAQAGVPSGWELVAELVNRYLYFNAAGAGAQTGNGTISVNGTTGSIPHSHPYAGSGGFEVVSYIDHPGNIYHSHAYSGSLVFESERYHVKFIKYRG